MAQTTTERLPAFESDARTVVRTVRGAFSDLLSQAGADARDPQSISDRVGLTKTLAWKVSKLVQSDDPAVALQHMPGSSGVRLLLRGAERAGVATGPIQIARDAVADFERLIKVHCGDRATLDIMGGELSPLGRAQRDEIHRRQLFQGASSVWGAQARLNHKIGVVAPGARDGLLDFASVNALVDFRRLRQDVRWVMASRHGSNDDGSAMSTRASEPIDPAFDGWEVCPLMGEFCSQPVPELESVTDRTGVTFELPEGPMGNVGALTCVVGMIQRGIPYYATPANEWGNHRALSDVPTELMIVDLFIHRSLTFALQPQARLVSELHAARGPGGSEVCLPLTEPVQDLGVGPQPPTTPEFPKYKRLLRAVFERTGWDAGAFHGFRVRVAYPAVPTALVMRYRLPADPG